MSMSMHVEGIRPPDEKWKMMKAIYDSCKAAGVELPREVDKFFDCEEPDPKGVIVSLTSHHCCRPYTADMQEGYEIDVPAIPNDVTIIRFVCSW